MGDVLKATYADLKTVKTRSTCQLILELPIEALTDVVGLLGAPVPGNEVWVAVARLNLDAEPAQNEPLRIPAKLSQIAGICCNEGGFQRFLAEEGNYDAKNAEDAAKYVRLICGVTSRADLDTNPEAARKWRELKGRYDFWLRGEAA